VTITQCVTKHGRDHHLMDLNQPHKFGQRLKTLCGADAYALSDRTWFWRRRLKMAST